MRLITLLIVAAVSLAACGFPKGGALGPQQRQPGTSPLNNWAIVVVGGDARTSQGQPSPIFDNARRDVAAAFLHAGFRGENMAQLSVNPGSDPGVAPTNSANFEYMAQYVTTGAPGCLFYFSSHGSQQGIAFGFNETLDPGSLSRLINAWCGERPTVVIVSACHSGVFVPALSGPNRMVLTAARADRSSFGCGGTDRYPYFDECVLNVLPQSTDFLSLANNAQACVSRREAETNASPPSEPQLTVGNQVQGTLSALRFTDSFNAPPPTPNPRGAPGPAPGGGYNNGGGYQQ